MYNISEEWVALTFMLGLILGIFGVISIVVLVYQNTKFEIMKRKILRRDDEIGMLRKQVENEKRNSGIDKLTGLYNRRYLEEKVQDLIDCSERYNYPLSYLFIDLDNFKKINDTLGHVKGDEVLKEVAQKLRIISRHTDTYVRLGGDEFFMVLPGTDKIGAKELAERLEKEISSISSKFSSIDKLGFGSSVGVFTHEEGVTFNQIIAESDREMYKVKERRKR